MNVLTPPQPPSLSAAALVVTSWVPISGSKLRPAVLPHVASKYRRFSSRAEGLMSVGEYVVLAAWLAMALISGCVRWPAPAPSSTTSSSRTAFGPLEAAAGFAMSCMCRATSSLSAATR